MRKKNLGSKIVKKAITWAMIVMMSFSGAMSGFASMTVYAEEVSDGSNQNEDTAGNQPQDAAIEVIENTNKTEETYVDNGLVADDPDTENNEITEAQTNNQLDHTKIETTVESVETHYVIENSNGDAIVGQDQNGNAVNKIEVNAEGTEVNTVKVIEKETNPDSEVTHTPAIEVVDEEKIIYGHFDESGVFVEGSKEEEGNLAYTLTDGTYKETTTVNVVKGIDGKTGENKDYFVKDEVVDVLNGETVDGYEKKTVYYVEGTEISAEDIDTVLEGNNYSIEEDTGILTVEATKTTTKKEYATLTFEGKNKPDIKIDITGKEVSIECVNDKKGKKVYNVTIDGTLYEDVHESCMTAVGHDDKRSLKVKSENETTYSILVNGESKTLEKDQVETRTTYQVTDSDNNVLCEIDATAKDYIEKRNYTKVNDMYVVKDKDNKDVYFTPQEWEIVTSKEVTYKEVTRYYYTSESKYEGKHFDITFKNDEDSLEYSLDINFWNGEYVKLDPDNAITYSEDEDGNIIVSIPYLYAEDYELTEDTEWKTGVFTRKISKSEFGVSRIATLNVKYEPVLSRAEKVTFKAEIVTETVEGETQGATTETTSIIVNNGSPVNEKPSKSMTYSHVDVQANTKVVIDGKQISASVSNLQVKATVFDKGDMNDHGQRKPGGGGNSQTQSTATETEIKMSNKTAKDPQGYYEYQSDHNLNISNQGYITITATVNYEYEGKKYSFDYTVKVYPKNDGFNTCQDKAKDGFDYLITDTALQAAIQEDIIKRSVVVTEKRDTTESATLGEAKESVDKTEIPVKVFVRLDNEKQKEDGSTHYSSEDYTSDLSVKYGMPLYLGYTTEGYQVHDNNLDGSTATEKIYTKLAGETFEENLRKLADLYIENEKSAQVQEYVEGDKFKSDIQKQIADAQKKAIEDDSELQDENGTIEWSYTVGGKTVSSLDEAIELAKELVKNLSMKDGTGVNWYVLKEESDGWHIDGVSKIPDVTITVQGEFVPTSTPSESPSASPSTTPSASPSTTPSASPSESPSASPSTSPSTTPSASPTTTPGGTTPTGGGGVAPDVAPDDGGDTPVIIPDAPVALAAAPAAADNGAAVLGARRTEGDATQAAVLGAKRGTEQAVLGKRRKPKTGDSAALSAWMAALTMATGAAGISGTKLTRRKKKEEKED